MLHRIYDSGVVPPALVGVVTAILGHLAELPLLSIWGLTISPGWLCVAVYDRWVKYHRG